MLVEKLMELAQAKIRLRPCHTNRASSIGHICERKLVFDRTRWQDAALHDVNLQLVFNEGQYQERQILKDLTDAGFQLIDQQRDYFWAKYQLTGHLDAKVVVQDTQCDETKIEAVPLECKSMSPFIFKTIHTADDILNSKRHYIRAYAAQMQIYLLLSNSPRGVLLLKDKSSGQIKEIWMELNLEVAESLIKKCERINAHVAANTVPEPIPWDEDICGRCAYGHICLPEAKREAITITQQPEIEADLNRRAELTASKKEYDDLDDKVKSLFKEQKESRWIIGQWLVTKRLQARQGKDVTVIKIDKLEVKKEVGDE